MKFRIICLALLVGFSSIAAHAHDHPMSPAKIREHFEMFIGMSADFKNCTVDTKALDNDQLEFSVDTPTTKYQGTWHFERIQLGGAYSGNPKDPNAFYSKGVGEVRLYWNKKNIYKMLVLPLNGKTIQCDGK